MRTRARLTELRRLKLDDVQATLQGYLTVLSLPILQPCLCSAQLLISVDRHTGIFLGLATLFLAKPFFL